MLDKNRLDIVLSNRRVGNFLLKRLKYTTIVSLDKPVTTTNGYLAFSKKYDSADIIQTMDKILLDIWEDGSYQKITDKY